MALWYAFRDQFQGSAFRLIVVRALVFCLLILSVFLPYIKITYYYSSNEQIFEHTWWYAGLDYEAENYAGSQSRVNWRIQWFAMPMFAFPFVLMYFGLKKRYTFDLGVFVFALFFCWMTLPPLCSPMTMGESYDLIESEALVGFYLVAITLVAYCVTRLFLLGATGDLEVDRISPPESVKESEVVKRRFILVLALLSFILPFAVQYKIFYFPEDEMIADLSTVYYWFGDVVRFGRGLRFSPYSLLFLPIVYLPLIMMWLGVKRTGLFNNGVGLFTIYWIWHLLFFLQPSYVTWHWRQEITAPTVGIVFFPLTVLLYILSFLFKSARIQKFLLESKGKKLTPKAFLKKCPKCGREIPIASEQCPYCGQSLLAKTNQK